MRTALAALLFAGAITAGPAFAQQPQQLPGILVTAPPKPTAQTKPVVAAPSPRAPAPASAPDATAVQSLDPSANDVGKAQSGSQGVVPREQLEARPIYRTGEVLEAVPGLVVTQHSGEGKANQYFLRGFNLDHGTDLAITVDGMPVNMRTHAHGQGYADTNFLIPELARGLAYRKGPYFAAEGDFASAGAIYLDVVDRLPKNFAQVEIGSFGHRARRRRHVRSGRPQRHAARRRRDRALRRPLGAPRRAAQAQRRAALLAGHATTTASPSPAWPTRAAGTPPTRSRSAPSIRA